jgi:ribosome-associated protein
MSTNMSTEDAMQKMSFDLSGEYVELNQLLKLSGLCDSGGAGKMLVASGVVAVDGKRELRKTCKIRAGQVVAIGDVRVSVHAGPASGDAAP